MKYVKTFENFNYETTNENWLWGEGNIWSKIGNWIRDWKDRKLAEGARIAQEWAKNNPEELEELRAEVKPHLDKISEEEKKKVLDTLQNFQGNIPTEVVAGLNESWGTLANRLAKFFGWTTMYGGPLILIITTLLEKLGLITSIASAPVLIGALVLTLPLVILGGTILDAAGVDFGPETSGGFRSGFTG